MALREQALRADLRRFYHVSLDDVGLSVSWDDAAAMAAYLPGDSAVERAAGDGWSELERLVAEVANIAASIWWMRTDHSYPGNDRPPTVRSPRERERIAEEESQYTREYMDEVADLLGIPEDRR